MNSPKTLTFRCSEIMHDIGHYSALLDLHLHLQHLVDALIQSNLHTCFLVSIKNKTNPHASSHGPFF